MNIPEYVAKSLAGASMRYLEEIVYHGIYNVDPKIEQGATQEEYDAIDKEFRRQAFNLIEAVLSEKTISKPLPGIHYDEQYWDIG